MQPVFLFRYPHKYHSFAQALGALMDSCFVWFKYWEFHFIPVFFHSFFFEINVFFHSCSSWYLMTNSSPFVKDFDTTYGPAWHCIVGTSFGSYVTHSLGGFLYFSVDKVHILLFRTAVEPIAQPQWDLKFVYSHMCRCSANCNFEVIRWSSTPRAEIE